MAKIKNLMSVICFMAALVFWGTLHVQAAVIEPTGDKEGKQDLRNIWSALEEDGEVRLKSGETYYIVKPIVLHSNQTIIANGATIVCLQGAFRSDAPTKVNYGSIKNVTVDGGTWKHASKEGLRGSMVMFCHGQKITIKNLDVSCHYTGHAIELIAVKDVVVDNCKVKALGGGTTDWDCHEEQIQIDIAAPETAPKVAAAGQQFVKGQTCENITVKNCTVTGSRGICANFTKTNNGKFLNKFHKNIVIKNNRIEGYTAEALSLFNVIGAVVEGNQIVTRRSAMDAYSVGLHIAMFGKAPAAMKKAVVQVKNNVVKGGRQGLLVYSHASTKFGKVVAQKNKFYAKNGKEEACHADTGSASEVILSGNSKHTW